MKKQSGNKILIALIILTIGISLGIILWANINISKLTESNLENEPDYRYHFSMVVDENDSPYWNLVYEGASKEAELENVIVEVEGINLAEDYSLYDRMNMAVSSKVDGIFMVPDGSQKIRNLISSATNSGIPVLSMMENDSISVRSGYVGINNYEQGQAYAKLVEKIASEKNKSNVVILTATQKAEGESNYSGDLIYSSIIEYINKKGLADSVKVRIENINRASVFNSKRDIQAVLATEESPDIIICTDYLFTLNACQMIVEKNLVGKVNILGSYFSDDILDYIQKGTLYGTVAIDPYELGRVCVSEMVELKDVGRTNDYMPLDMMIIDKSNVAEYQQKYVEVNEDEK